MTKNANKSVIKKNNASFGNTIFTNFFNQKKKTKPQKKTENYDNKEEITQALIPQNSLFFKYFAQIDEIVDYFSKIKFKVKYTKNYIIDVLHANSFDFKNTYIQLKYGDAKFAFTQKDDYIIKFMADTELYNQLCLVKGINNVEIRKKYLKVDN